MIESVLNNEKHATYKVSVDMIYVLDLTQSGCTSMQLKEKDCEKNDILYVMTKKQTDLPFMMSNYCMYRNHEITQNVTQEIATVYHLTCVYRGEGRTFRD